MRRRDFLSAVGGGLGSFALSAPLLSRLSYGAEQNDTYLVFCYFEGGWDQLLGLDPRDPVSFPDADAVETGIEPAYQFVEGGFPTGIQTVGEVSFGPCIGELAQLTDQFSVIRGINMATLTHEVGRRYFITGRPPSGLQARGSSAASLAASQLAEDRPVPNLALRVESYSQDLPSYAGALSISFVQHLQFILKPQLGIPTYIPPKVQEALEAHAASSSSCLPAGGYDWGNMATIYRENQQRAKDLVTGQLYSLFDFTAPALAAVRQHYGFDTSGVESPYGRAALAAQALKSGLSRVVSVVLADALDTHDGSWENDHGIRLNAGFNALARLITDLRDSEAPGGGSFLDKTVFLAFSEFSRTARRNSRRGRDHNLCNSVLLGGRGLQSGKVIGASSDLGMAPEHLNLETGLADPEGISLKPEHVLSTLLTAAQLDPSSLIAPPIAPLLIQK
jgi:hypothetical protein